MIAETTSTIGRGRRFWLLAPGLVAGLVALVHGLVFIGLLLAVLIRPPINISTNINTMGRNLLTTIVAAISGAVFLLVTQIPLVQKFLYIESLQSPGDYQFVAIVSLVWGAGFAVFLLLMYSVKLWRGASKKESV